MTGAEGPSFRALQRLPMQGQVLAEEIVRRLRRHKGERHVIALQDYPDPDAIASAMAHQFLSRALHIETDIIFAGEVSHHQNRKLIERLQVHLRLVRDREALAGIQGAVFVDNQGTTCPYLVRLLDRANVPTVLAIDHHEGETPLPPEVILAERVGATSTLFAELFQGGHLQLEPGSTEGRLLATGLLYGIRTDTQALGSATPRDRAAAAWLDPWHDAALLQDVLRENMPRETEALVTRAWVNRVVKDGFVFAGVGYLEAQHRDALPQAASWLLTQADVHTSVVFGIVRDWRLLETLSGSLRTVRPSPSPTEFLHQALGPEAGLDLSSGGRAFAGGFEVPIGMSARASTIAFQMARWAYYEGLILERLSRAGSAEARSSTPSSEAPSPPRHPPRSTIWDS